MAAPSRTAQFGKLHKILKKHYKPVAPDPNRPVLEHLLMACCLENAHYQPAEEAFAALVHTFFDWNEVRVSTIRELSEVMAGLPDPPAAASRVKRVLQHVFEASYSFDLEALRKSNLGPAIERLSKLDGTTPFCIAYVVQSTLGGHAIPIDAAVLGALHLVDLISDEDVEACAVPGLERAIPKSKGIEFGSQLHQLGADFTANPYSPAVREILLQINPDVQGRLPKRRRGKPPRGGSRHPADAVPPPAEQPQPQPRDSKSAGETPAKKRSSRRKKTDPDSAQGLQAEPNATPPGPVPPTAKKRPPSARKKADSGKSKAPGDQSEKVPPSAGLSKRKPR